MAELNWDDFKRIRSVAYSQGTGKEELKALDPFPSKNTIFSMFQAIEDAFVTAYPTFKADIESTLGQSVSNPLAQKMIRAWFDWKASKLLG